MAPNKVRRYCVCTKCQAGWVWESQLKQGTKIFCQFCGKKYPNLQSNNTPSQPPAPVQQSAPPSPKGGNPGGKTKGKGKGKGKGPAPPPPAVDDQPSQGSPLKGVLKTLHTNWAELASTTRDELVKAGFKPPTPPKEDPLLLALKANKEGLPQEVKDALEASEATPAPTQEEQVVTSANVLSRAGARLKSLTKRRIDLQATITSTKETLRLQLEELQAVIKKLAQAQEEVEKSKEAIAAATLAGEHTGDNPDQVQAQTYSKVLTQLGVTLTDEQQAKLQDIVKTTASSLEAPPGLPLPESADQKDEDMEPATVPEAGPPAGKGNKDKARQGQDAARERSRSPRD